MLNIEEENMFDKILDVMIYVCVGAIGLCGFAGVLTLIISFM